MSLIEVLFFYRDMVKTDGRHAANRWLIDTVDAIIFDHVVHSVSDNGYFLSAEGCVYNLPTGL